MGLCRMRWRRRRNFRQKRMEPPLQSILHRASYNLWTTHWQLSTVLPVYLIIYTTVAFAISTHAAGTKCLMARLQCDYTMFQLCVILFWDIFVIYCGKSMQPHRKHHNRHQSKLKGQVGNRYVNAMTKLSGQYTLYKANHWFEVKGTQFFRNSTNVSRPNKLILNQM